MSSEAFTNARSWSVHSFSRLKTPGRRAFCEERRDEVGRRKRKGNERGRSSRVSSDDDMTEEIDKPLCLCALVAFELLLQTLQ